MAFALHVIHARWLENQEQNVTAYLQKQIYYYGFSTSTT